MYILLIETSGNQRYIFSTNKLRENIGASELIYQIGTKVVLEAVGKTFTDTQNLQKFLLNDGENPPIEKQGNDGVEIIIATSGKALLLTKTPEKAKEIVSFVTKKALIEMPGLTVHGAIVEVKDDLTDIHSAVGEIHRKLENIRYQIPSSQQRFQRLPFVEPCATSGLPAKQIYQHESLKTKAEELKPHSGLSIKKQDASDESKNRLENTIKSTGLKDFQLPANINELEKTFPNTNWLAVIHADGNGLGEIFLNFHKYLTYPSQTFNGRTYINEYRKFSAALDECSIKAAVHGLKNLQNKADSVHSSQRKIPLIPLILGGDDLTVICDGEYAIKFTYDFLTEFENQTAQNNLIKSIAQKAFGVERLGICAGVAIIKPHFPFHQAYDLAESLLKSAKKVKTEIKHKFTDKNGKSRTETLPASAMDFHVLYDSSGVELKEIREKLIVDDGKTYLYAKPYIVSNLTETPDDKTWMEKRVWNELQSRVCAMIAKDDDSKNKLPNSQLHHIRESLFRGRKETDSEVNLFRHRYKDAGFGKLLCEKTVKNETGEDKKEYSLFFDEKHKKDGKEFDGHTTHFLDALDVVELWGGFACPEENGVYKTEVNDEQ